MELDDIDLDSIEAHVTGKEPDDPQIQISYAEFKDGTELTEEQLQELDHIAEEYLNDKFWRGELWLR